MVARGDLGLEIPLERVPRVQKEILRKARARGVPAIVATQVLESMRLEPRPTRAEASDAAGAVDSGADAIMLSAETATGLYPVRSVEVLDAIIRDAESMPPPRGSIGAAGATGESHAGAERGGGHAGRSGRSACDRRGHARRQDREAAVGDRGRTRRSWRPPIAPKSRAG